MFKLMIVGRRRPGMNRRQFGEHLRFVHGPMVFDPPADAGVMPDAYAQNHVFDGVHLGSDGGPCWMLDKDFVTVVGFETMENLAAGRKTIYYLQNLAPDEDKFVDQSTVRPGVYRPSERRTTAAGPFKIFVFLTARDPTLRPGLTTAVHAAADRMIGQGLIQDGVVNTALSSPTGPPPLCDLVLELWLGSKEDAYRVAAEAVAPLLSKLAADLASPNLAAVLMAEEYPTERLRADLRARRPSKSVIPSAPLDYVRQELQNEPRH